MVWTGIASAALGGLSQLAGGFMSAQGAAGANAANVAAQNMANQQMLNAQMAGHAQNTAFMEDQQAFGREERQFAENFSAHQADLARGFASDQAGRQMTFQRDMANTAYQRAMVDMKAAGLNPILAYQQGGAASPPGAQGSSPSPGSSGASSAAASAMGAPSIRAPVVQPVDMGRAVGQMVSSGLDALKTFEGIDLLKEQTKTEGWRQTLVDQQGRLTREQKFRTKEEIDKVKAETSNLKALFDFIRANTGKTVSEAGIAAKELLDVLKHGSKYMPGTIERILRGVENPPPQQLPRNGF